VTYTQLGAGTYRFRVRASNNSGVWNPEEKVITLVVDPAPWRTWWAYLAYALIILSIVGSYIHTQKSKIRHAATVNVKLMELDRLKDNFMANTSHELRTPVNGILGISHALQEEIATHASESVKEKLTIIMSCGRRLARLVNDILDFSAIKKSQLILNKSCVDLNDSIPQIICECRLQHVNANTQVENLLKPNLPSVFVDSARAATIFYNLISNAFKFTEKGFIRISASYDDNRVSISVADTGIGIDKQQLANLFSSFEQVAVSGVHQQNGAGLGLAMSKHLAELQGGSLTVESTLGVGSVFTVTLPRATESQLAESLVGSREVLLPSVSKEPAQREHVEVNLPVFYPKGHDKESVAALTRILVVDDEPVNRMVLRHMLLKRNCLVFEAANGQDMVDAFTQGFICDLILLDIMMPKLSGIEGCRQLRQSYSMNELPIIFVTAKTQQQDRDECMSVGGNDFMTKPVANEELYARLDSVMAEVSENRQTGS
jgi:signal transduction histidine kinase/ActR/RegA family two-component response regulator